MNKIRIEDNIYDSFDKWGIGFKEEFRRNYPSLPYTEYDFIRKSKKLLNLRNSLNIN